MNRTLLNSFSIPILMLVLQMKGVSAQAPDTVEFFENRIRPVFIEHCYECHSSEADEVGGSLLLDSSDRMMVGGDSGPALVPGDSEASLLVSALKYESSEMPPNGQLDEHVISDIQKWVDAGAIDPRRNPSQPRLEQRVINIEKERGFWAFQPIRSPEVPIIDSGNALGPLDAFLLSSQQRNGIVANELAPPAVRLRRLHYDLVGLPPSPDSLESWVADPSPQHWGKIVDELLSSIHFAEHWSRHWMDVARYADSNGSDFNATFHDAWRYRDFLIRSFASDVPVDQQIRAQIAGDLLPASGINQQRDNIIATTFLMLGPKMLSERDKLKMQMDIVDEQIDTIGRAFMGLTLGCARCHDHKFDAVPTEDYYALAGIFRSTRTIAGESQEYVSTWQKTPLPVSDARRREWETYQNQTDRLQSQIKSLKSEILKLQKSNEWDGIVVDDTEAIKKGEWTESTYFHTFVGQGYVHDSNRNKGKSSITFKVRLPQSGRYEVRLAYSPSGTRAASVPVTVEDRNGVHKVKINQRKPSIEPIWGTLGHYDFDADIDASVVVRNDGTNGYVIADAVQFLQLVELGKDETEKSNRAKTQSDDSANQLLESKRSELAELEEQLVELKRDAPAPIPTAMAVSDYGTKGESTTKTKRPLKEAIGDCEIHIRGEIGNLGRTVPRGFLQICSGGDSKIAAPQGSGRVEFANWLTDPDHPLTSRVFVNRVWMHLMGEGLVRTVDNFGKQGDRPVHPELLDYLSSGFIRDGWHLKTLVRKIVTSASYQRSSRFDPANDQIDPENRHWWRMPRRRLTAEAIRDTMLLVGGQLSFRPQIEPMKGYKTLVSKNSGDSKVKVSDASVSYRSVYMPVVRGYVSPLMLALDVADPDLLVGKRPTTSVPSQTLVLLNNPEINQWAMAAANRICQQEDEFEERLELAYQVCYARGTRSTDRERAGSFFGDNPEIGVDDWKEFLAAMFAAAEFRLLD